MMIDRVRALQSKEEYHVSSKIHHWVLQEMNLKKIEAVNPSKIDNNRIIEKTHIVQDQAQLSNGEKINH